MLIVAGSSISQDVYNGIIRKGKASDRSLLLLSRLATLATGLLGLGLALSTDNLVYSIVSYAWAGIGCSFAPAILLSFYWPRFGGRGVVTALLVGLVTTVVWISTGLDAWLTAMAVTFFAAIGTGTLVTLLRPENRAEANSV
jgi:sodium/proline symporter